MEAVMLSTLLSIVIFGIPVIFFIRFINKRMVGGTPCNSYSNIMAASIAREYAAISKIIKPDLPIMQQPDDWHKYQDEIKKLERRYPDGVAAKVIRDIKDQAFDLSIEKSYMKGEI